MVRSRKKAQSVCSSPSTFSGQFSVSILAPCAAWRGKTPNQGRPDIEDESFFPPACRHSSHYSSLSPAFAQSPYPISKSFCGSAPTRWGGRQCGSRSSSSITSVGRFLQSKHESLPLRGGEGGQGHEGFKTPFLGPDLQKPPRHHLLVTPLPFITEPSSSRALLPVCVCVCNQSEF